MCITQCMLALAALSVGLAHSWDIAVTTGNQLEFYSNYTKTQSVQGLQFQDLTALAYDAVHNMLLFVDKQNDNASIFSYNLATKKYQALVRRRSDENIQGLAFDPVKGLLFWTDTKERSIYWISMKPESKNNVYGNLLIQMLDEIPRSIAVDSCGEYIYWTNMNVLRPTIERARYNGTEREEIINTNIYMPVSLAIDQQTKRMYWADDMEGIHYSIESADLDGKNRRTLIVGTYHQPNAITVSKDSVYWVDWGYRKAWKLPKNATKVTNPTELISFKNELPFGIAANYQIRDQTEGHSECKALASLSPNSSAINDTFNIPTDAGLFCVHGTKVNGKTVCNCTTGYTGERCDISVCQNYCLSGDCSVTHDGHPKCSCKAGHYGERCEVSVCHAYCLNNGVCRLDENKDPTCQCYGDHEGLRCEKVKVVTTEASEPAENVEMKNETCICNNSQNASRASIAFSSEHFAENDSIIESCSGWDPVRDPIIMVLGILCGLLCLACTVLITKVLQLKKRPRIKKRIIVNKNVTPMTARPDQCEITIENCCNMNICETPCFEPRSTIRPSLLDSKPGKEEKKNLIANMEYNDDPY